MRKLTFVFLAGMLLLPLVSIPDDSTEKPASAKFTGIFSDSAVDDDGNGYYEFLLVLAEVQVDVAGTFMLCGTLWSGDSIFISTAPYWGSTILDRPNTTIKADSGIATFGLRFSGEMIRRSGSDDSYIAHLELRGETGDTVSIDNFRFQKYQLSPEDSAYQDTSQPVVSVTRLLDRADVLTSPYNHLDFREEP